jgi:hypothetical protein
MLYPLSYSPDAPSISHMPTRRNPPPFTTQSLSRAFPNVGGYR